MTVDAPVICEWEECDRPLPPYTGNGRPRKYHPECKQRKDNRKKAPPRRDRYVKPINRPFSDSEGDADGRTQFRQPPDEFIAGRWAYKISDDGLSTTEVAKEFGVERPTVTRWVAWVQREDNIARRRIGWSPPSEATSSAQDYLTFRDRYMRQANGKPYITAGCHLRWAGAIDDAVANGSQQAIAAPPRHGKTEALIHKCVQLIVNNPNIRILWIGGNEDIAAEAVGMVKAELEGNERLIADFCGPGGSFVPPPRSGKKWTSKEFTVATRTANVKGATMKAIGRTGKILSLNADIIICDDLEDDQSTAQPAQREATLRWFNKDVASRKEEHTAWFYIGSRQHPEDLINHLLLNEEWEVIVEQAHDDGCTLPATAHDEHTDCMLFPEMRSHRWLMQKRRTVGASIFEMQYLNRPRVEGLVIFDREAVEGCLNRTRRIGEVPANCRLIAGLDPASKQYQAAILWAVDLTSGARYLVDLENEKAGSTPHLRRILVDWHDRYRVTDWVIEDNIIDDVLAHDEKVLKIRAERGLRFIPHHTTGSNKWDSKMGVTSMVPLFEQRIIDLPYAGEDTQARVDVYINQLVHFEGMSGRRSKWAKDDLVMAGWFPEKTIKSWGRERHTAVASRTSRGTPFPSSRPARTPWRRTGRTPVPAGKHASTVAALRDAS